MLSVIRKQQGLTLTEIIVVIGMLAIVTLLLVPNYQSYLAQNRVKGAAESLYSHFILARTTAISSSQNVTVTFNTADPWCYGISSGATSCACTSAPSISNCNLGIISRTDFPNTTLSSSGFTSNMVTFDAARGTLSNTAGYVDFALTSGQSVRVYINKFGVPKTCSSTVGGYKSC
ncbi:MAG: hypothetical protein COY58_03465 [Gammaproteobacteria bacterium CG_4_10_14_0_8_um_filter_38_16]|nr:MAG: hypothetical protein COY58_03465 [Gammaproteobacteria bacterium CG_4_10_14_0_8_um_filter_38_16]PJA03641.1 MAG: hypothetical protein COX72_03850 [Gammaproteobacteria bacterium CG_4_10_14_0_2_um_filter_38_22]PJB11307.1 MAG: hypothetical protein CO120_00655 [Gammaproteobacteria bacterium CG_4_9_14_3_um_filter_38_9]